MSHLATSSSLTPPSAERTLRRERVLLAVTTRSMLELLPERWPEAPRVRAWLTRHALWSEVQPDERALLCAEPGSVEVQRAIDRTWRAERVADLC